MAEADPFDDLSVAITDKLGSRGEVTDIQQWHSIATGSLIHHKGILPPPLIMQLIPSSRLVVRGN